jgi:hypothetical protein
MEEKETRRDKEMKAPGVAGMLNRGKILNRCT